MRTAGYIFALIGLTIACAAIVFVVNAPKWLTVTSQPNAPVRVR